MTATKEIYEFINSFAPFATAMSFDNAGLLVGSKQAAVEKALLALDITPQVVKEAKFLGAQLIISHHPVIFEPMRTLTENSVPYMLARHGISAICAHTNLDLAEDCGVNTCLANALQLQNVRHIPSIAMAVGTLGHPLSGKDFAAYVKHRLACTGLRYSQHTQKIQTVAVSGGSGGDNIFEAVNQGADAFVTGEIKHHLILEAVNAGVMVVDVGHYKSENVVITPLWQKLSSAFAAVQFIVSAEHTDTVEYL